MDDSSRDFRVLGEWSEKHTLEGKRLHSPSAHVLKHLGHKQTPLRKISNLYLRVYFLIITRKMEDKDRFVQSWETRPFPEKLGDRTKESVTVELVTLTDDHQSRKSISGGRKKREKKRGKKTN